MTPTRCSAVTFQFDLGSDMRGSTGVPQRVLIVGGSSEIGSSLAAAWLRRGTRHFVVTQRAPGNTRGLVALLEDGGATVTSVSLDAHEADSIEDAMNDVWIQGDVDVAVVAIGVLGDQREIEAHPSLAWDVMTVNATATIHIALEVARRMEVQQHGSLVLLSSVAGQRGRRDNYVYGASKAALDAFAEGLQQRFADSEVNVLVVRPGYVHTKMSSGVAPAPFAVTVEESRDRIISAVEGREDVVWVPSILGAVFYVLRMLPRRVWAVIAARAR